MGVWSALCLRSKLVSTLTSLDFKLKLFLSNLIDSLITLGGVPKIDPSLSS